MASMRQTPLTCSGHTRPVVDLAFSSILSSKCYLISACLDGKPMLRYGDTGDWIGTFVHKGAVWSVALNNDASRAATGTAEYTAKLWDAITGEEIHTFNHQKIVKTVDFSADGNYLLTGSNENVLRIFDLEKPEEEPFKYQGHTSSIKQALFLQNKYFISASDDKTVRVWDRVNQQEIKKLEFNYSPSSMEVSADEKTLIITYGNTVTFWNTETWEKDKEFSMPSKINSASLHPTKEVFVCGGEDFKVYKCDADTGVELESFKGHFGPVHCIRFSPDGELYASGSEDGTLRLWQTIVGKTYGLWKCITEETVAEPSASSTVST